MNFKKYIMKIMKIIAHIFSGFIQEWRKGFLLALILKNSNHFLWVILGIFVK